MTEFALLRRLVRAATRCAIPCLVGLLVGRGDSVPSEDEQRRRLLVALDRHLSSLRDAALPSSADEAYGPMTALEAADAAELAGIVRDARRVVSLDVLDESGRYCGDPTAIAGLLDRFAAHIRRTGSLRRFEEVGSLDLSLAELRLILGDRSTRPGATTDERVECAEIWLEMAAKTRPCDLTEHDRLVTGSRMMACDILQGLLESGAWRPSGTTGPRLVRLLEQAAGNTHDVCMAILPCEALRRLRRVASSPRFPLELRPRVSIMPWTCGDRVLLDLVGDCVGRPGVFGNLAARADDFVRTARLVRAASKLDPGERTMVLDRTQRRADTLQRWMRVLGVRTSDPSHGLVLWASFYADRARAVDVQSAVARAALIASGDSESDRTMSSWVEGRGACDASSQAIPGGATVVWTRAGGEVHWRGESVSPPEGSRPGVWDRRWKWTIPPRDEPADR